MKPSTARKLKEALTGYGFLSFNIVGFMAFTAIPVVFSLALSLYKYDNITPAKYVGLDNYKKLLGFHYESATEDEDAAPVDAATAGPASTGPQHLVANDPNFWHYLGNTLFMMLGLPLTMVGALILAMALNRGIHGRLVFRAIYYLPSISPIVALALVWVWVLNPTYGSLNGVLSSVPNWFIDQSNGVFGTNLTHVTWGPNWLGDLNWAKPAMIMIAIWGGIGGFTMLLYLAALQGIPGVYYEAASIDGASRWQQFRNITWPLLGPVNFFVIVMGVIAGFHAFDMQYVMTQGGPAGATTTIAYYIFNNAFSFSKMGYASAIAWVLFAIIFTLTLLQWRYRKKYTFQYD
jgi:multiple sugar transport system permease protein